MTDSSDGHNGQQVRITARQQEQDQELPSHHYDVSNSSMCVAGSQHTTGTPPIQALWLLQQGDRGYLLPHTHCAGWGLTAAGCG